MGNWLEKMHAMISVIIPTYNERDNLPILIDLIHSCLRRDYEVIVVDDSSPDGTYLVAGRLAEKYPVRVVVRPCKMGLASAVVEGFRNACGEFFVVMDADLQHPPERIGDMIGMALGGYDIVIGSRYIEQGGVEGLSFFRRLVSRGAIIISKIFVPKLRGIKDPVSGFFLVRRNVIDIDKLSPKGFKILMEIIVKSNTDKIVEIPYIFKSRGKGKSKLKFNEYILFLIHVLKLMFYSIHNRG